jgi:hypothetical protein
MTRGGLDTCISSRGEHMAMCPNSTWPRSLIHMVDFGDVAFRQAATWSRPIFTCGHLPHALIHVAMWTRVINTRCDMATWIHYTRQYCHMY